MSVTNVARVGKRGNICVGNNVSSFARAYIAKRASDFMTQTRLRQTNWNGGGDFDDFFKGKSRCS